MTDPRHVVIVGSGLAGASAAAALRERGFAGKVTLFGQDRYRPYELPALSKGILLGDTDHAVGKAFSRFCPDPIEAVASKSVNFGLVRPNITLPAVHCLLLME